MTSQFDHPVRGAALAIGAVLLFACLDAVTKDLTTRVAIVSVVWGRYIVHCLFTVIAFWPQAGARMFRTGHLPLQIVRGVAMVATTGLVVLALRHLPLAETTAMVFVGPLIAASLAVPLLGERMSLARAGSTIVGFLGVLLIARPGAALSGPGIAYALGGAACYAVYQIVTRRLSTIDPPVTQLFYMALIGSAILVPLLPWVGDPGEIALRDWLQLLLVGLLAGTGHYLMIRAFRVAAVTTIAPYVYFQLVWAMALGWFAFGHWPDPYALCGIAVVSGSGLFMALAGRR